MNGTQSHTVAYTKESRVLMTYSLPPCCLYKRAKKVNDLLTPTILPLHKSQGCDDLVTPTLCLYKEAHSHTAA